MMAPWMRVLGWVAGAPLALLRYVLVTRKCIDEQIVDGADANHGACAPDMPDYLRSADSGAGLATHRRFSLRICDSQISAEQLATIVSSDPNLVSPWEVLRWELPDSERRRLAPGDDVLIRMAGPWNGALRVIERDAERLRLQTQSGSALKGELELRLHTDDGSCLPRSSCGSAPTTGCSPSCTTISASPHGCRRTRGSNFFSAHAA